MIAQLTYPPGWPPVPVPLLSLSQIPLFADLSDKQRAWLADRLHRRTFPAGIDIITAGADGEVAYILLNGSVKVYIQLLDGNAVIVNILGPGEIVGEMSLVDNTHRSASVITLEETTVMWLDQTQFDEAMQTMPLLARNLMHILSRRVRNSTEHIRSLAALDVHGRVAQQLLVFAERYGQKQADGSVFIPIRLPQGEISDLVGASRKRVNQVIVVFKRAGWISIDDQYRITLLDLQALKGC